MMLVGRYLARLGLTFWLGEMLFFIVIFAPRVFKVLPRDMAGLLQSHLFPPYYAAGLVSAGVLTLGLGLQRQLRPVPVALIAVAAAVFAYSLFSITPELNGLRPQMQDPEVAARFAVLHKLSVQVNGAALLCLLALLALV